MARLSFGRQLARAVKNIEQDERFLMDAICAHVERSILFGSPVTGAPGQPVRSGRLLNSWRRRREGTQFTMLTNLFYAPIIEDNRRGAQLRSSVGGFHSVKMTRAGFHAIVRYEVDRLASGGGYKGGAFRDAGGRFARL